MQEDHFVLHRRRGLPAARAGRPSSPHSELLPEPGRLLLEDAAGPMMLTTGSDRCFTGRLAFDGNIRSSPLTSGRFIGDWYSKGLFGTRVLQLTGYVFFHATEGQEDESDLRHLRGQHTHFIEPPNTSLAGAEAFASIEVPPGCKLSEVRWLGGKTHPDAHDTVDFR